MRRKRWFYKKQKRKHRKSAGSGFLWGAAGLAALWLLGIFLGKVGERLGPPPLEEGKIVLYRSALQVTEELPFEEYIAGVVAAEMPALFHPEALKAQAVCARTYTYQRLLSGQLYEAGAQVSDDPGVCQAYVSYEAFRQRHPQDTELYYEKIRRAVADTIGEILTIDGQPVEALYHSTCGGKTEAAEEVWGQAVAGLQSVLCEGCESSPYYRREWFFSHTELEQLLGSSRLQILETSATGRVKRATVGEEGQTVLSGEQVRGFLGLPSTWFELQPKPDGCWLRTRGFGHGLGLCQFGAGGMADSGCTYQEILQHYYTGASLTVVK